MKKLFLVLSIVAGLGFATTSCNKEKTCVCTNSYEFENGDEYQDSDTNEVITKDDCSDLNSTEENTPVPDVTKKTTCKEK